MKRDLDLMRDMMLCIEENVSGFRFLRRDSFLDLCDDKDVIAYHLRILVEAGFIDAQDVSSNEGEDYAVHGLTYAGCDYLDSVRSSSVWSQVKERLKKIGGIASTEIIKKVADSIAASQLGF